MRRAPAPEGGRFARCADAVACRRMPSITELLATGAPLVLPGTWDALSALLAERAGFETVFLSGYCLSATRLGQPDFGLLAGTDVVETARRIRLAVARPLIVDIDTG